MQAFQVFPLSGGLILRIFGSAGGLAFCLSAQAAAQAVRTPHTDALVRQGKLGITVPACSEVEARLGQVLYVNVDGFGYDGTGRVPLPPAGEDHASGAGSNEPDAALRIALHPAYVALVEDLQIGAVLPHFGTDDFDAVRASTDALRAASREPLLIGVDYASVRIPEVPESRPGSASNRWGLGWGEGFMKECDRMSDSCFDAIATVDAFLHRAAGLNQALGPTIDEPENRASLSTARVERRQACARRVIDAYHRQGVATVVKHYPYTPGSYNLHRKTEASEMPLVEVDRRLELFGGMSGPNDSVMSTHLFHPGVDPDDLATFSERWISRLRSDLGFQGLLVTDGLFMMRQYAESMRRMSSRWEGDQGKVRVTDEDSIFAARSLLAGHDQAMLEGTASDTRKVFRNLHALACQDTTLGRRLRERILESSARVLAVKQARRASMTQKANAPRALVGRALALRFRLRDLAKDGGSCASDAEWMRFRGELGKLALLPLE